MCRASRNTYKHRYNMNLNPQLEDERSVAFFFCFSGEFQLQFAMGWLLQGKLLPRSMDLPPLKEATNYWIYPPWNKRSPWNRWVGQVNFLFFRGFGCSFQVNSPLETFVGYVPHVSNCFCLYLLLQQIECPFERGELELLQASWNMDLFPRISGCALWIFKHSSG